jgi:hypothetical protein
MFFEPVDQLNVWAFFSGQYPAQTGRVDVDFFRKILFWPVNDLRLCWEFAFGANLVKFYSERGTMKEHSLS